MIYLDDPDFRLYQGDALEILRELPSESVHTCVTSPPFFGLRDYGTGQWEGGDEGCDHLAPMPGGTGASTLANYDNGLNDETTAAKVSQRRAQYRDVCGRCGARRVDQQIGLEAEPSLWVGRLVAVFREARRVLRSDGTCWIEVGDGFTEKQLGGHPWRLAEALRSPYYAGEIKNAADRVWLAAIVDGEGSINIHRRPAGQNNYATFTKRDGTVSTYERKNDSFQPKVEISNTSLRLIERVVALTGEGNADVKQEAGTFGRKQTIYRWTLTADKARAFLREVYPHLVAKQHEARLAFGCPSSGDKATAAWEGLKLLHAGSETTADFPEPPTLYEAGWFLRSDIIWARQPPNPMPESVTDRPTKSHSYVFLLSKSARYYMDMDAIREAHSRDSHNDGTTDGDGGKFADKPEYAVWRASHVANHPAGRNARSVWTIPTQPLAEPHYAAYPEELVRRCVLAGTSERGVCPECGAPWRRTLDRKFYGNLRTEDNKDGHADLERGITRNEFGGQKKYAEYEAPKTTGWEPTCGHQPLPPVPATVLDPFLGSGTTALVARKHGRKTIGIELAPDYCEIAAGRTRQLSLLAGSRDLPSFR